MDGQFVFLNPDESYAFTRDDALKAVHYEDQYYISAEFLIDEAKPIQRGMYVGYYDLDEVFQLFIVEKPVIDAVNKTISFQATLAALLELHEDIIEDRRPSNCQAGVAVSVALEPTIWSLGTAVDTIVASNHFYYQKPWAALQEIAKKYGCFFQFRVVISDAGIVGRYVDIVNRLGRDSGMRFEIYKNVDSLIYQIDDSEVRTALYGRGKGEEVGTATNGDPTYGRRINFENVVWSVENGDPCNKPAGQGWIEDVSATQVFGRNGRKITDVVIFSDCTDENELIKLTWARLQEICTPKVTINLTARVLEEKYGYKHEVVRLGDTVDVIIDDVLHVSAEICTLARDLVGSEETELTIGNKVVSIIDVQTDTAQTLEKAEQAIEMSKTIVNSNPDLLKGIINTMVTRIMSEGTNMDTDPTDGSLIFTSADGTSAVKLTGRGILIADKKIDGQYVWRTAIDGTGMNADIINAGVINATVVKILGTDRFYWDSQNIYIFDPENSDRQIRIGMYDGENYGIAYTQDGGTTWQTAIGFDGVNVNVSGFSKSYIQLEEPTGQEFGDRWTKTAPRTWQALAQFTFGQIKDVSWDEAAGFPYPKTYVWDGETWLLESDMRVTADVGDYGDRISKVETEVRQTASQISSMARAEDVNKAFSEMNSLVTQNAKNWTAEFNRVGLAGKQTGVTKIDEYGIEVKHSNINGSTVMNADGFKMLDGDGNVIGGMHNVDGEATSAVQELYNPKCPAFRAKVGESHVIGESAFGVDFKYRETVGGRIGAYSHDGYTAGGLYITSDKQVYIEAGTSINLVGGGAAIRFMGDGDIQFEFLHPDNGLDCYIRLSTIYSELV